MCIPTSSTSPLEHRVYAGLVLEVLVSSIHSQLHVVSVGEAGRGISGDEDCQTHLLMLGES